MSAIKFSAICTFGTTKQPFDFYLGWPKRGEHPMNQQSKWLGDNRGGNVASELMTAIADIYSLAAENNADPTKLALYALNVGKNAEDNKKNKSYINSNLEDNQEYGDLQKQTDGEVNGGPIGQDQNHDSSESSDINEFNNSAPIEDVSALKTESKSINPTPPTEETTKPQHNVSTQKPQALDWKISAAQKIEMPQATINYNQYNKQIVDTTKSNLSEIAMEPHTTPQTGMMKFSSKPSASIKSSWIASVTHGISGEMK